VNKKALLSEIISEYKKKHKKSEEHYKKSVRYLIRGGSHTIRLWEPFPIYDVHCQGSKVIDIDGNSYVDFWQGHFSNILGHNPDIILDALQEHFQKKSGLLTGFPSILQEELAKTILKLIDAEKIRFTTSGALATMYAVMLSKAFTNRDLVLKVGGGWHGAHPYLLKGVGTFDKGFNKLESAGLHPDCNAEIIICKFNNIEHLKDTFSKYGERIACFIIEPFIGAGGFLFADKEYLQAARDLTRTYESLLIFDEIVSGFRFCPSGLQILYQIKPDLSTFGKVIGGGMPIAAVAGREDILQQCDPKGPSSQKVRFEGGTFSVHPSALVAGLTLIRYLVEHQDEIYPEIGSLGEKIRKGAEEIFKSYQINAQCTGWPTSDVKHSSIAMLNFPVKESVKKPTPEDLSNPDVSDAEMREWIFKLAMLNEGFIVFHGIGSISTAHTDGEIDQFLAACEKVAKKFKKYI
jgi:glutamate-1-semialdehyde 2,1-aminomutase